MLAIRENLRLLFHEKKRKLKIHSERDRVAVEKYIIHSTPNHLIHVWLCKDTVIYFKVFYRFMLTIQKCLAADQSYITLAKSFVTTAPPGKILTLFAAMIVHHIKEHKR